MKSKRLIFSALIASTLALLGPKPAFAWIFQEVPDKTMTVRYRFPVAADINLAVSTNAIAKLIDLNDTTNWPHKDTGFINISSIRIEIDKTAASTTTVKIGVVNMVDTSTGSITWFHTVEGVKDVSNTNVIDVESYTPNFICTKTNVASNTLADGSTPFIASNELTSGTTLIRNSITYQGVTNGNTMKRGDIVLGIINGIVAETVTVEIQYHSMPR